MEAGVSEEALTRLFLVSLLARLFQAGLRRTGPPPTAVKWAAIGLAALAFGALHFTNMAVFGDPFTPANVSYVLLGNAILGAACGWLYTRYGIESAMAAGFVGHGVFPQVLRMHGIAVLS
jgi:membrane protease YdiL (CAAX protease family)